MELPGKVALMTGATGFVGRRTAQRLVLAGMRVRGLARRLVELPDLERSLGDITAAATVAPAAVGAHVVGHGATRAAPRHACGGHAGERREHADRAGGRTARGRCAVYPSLDDVRGREQKLYGNRSHRVWCVNSYREVAFYPLILAAF
jgi:NAD(P)-dependent dehydrogenase (short-subunit alcohol dehydrogenase family)